MKHVRSCVNVGISDCAVVLTRAWQLSSCCVWLSSSSFRLISWESLSCSICSIWARCRSSSSWSWTSDACRHWTSATHTCTFDCFLAEMLYSRRLTKINHFMKRSNICFFKIKHNTELFLTNTFCKATENPIKPLLWLLPVKSVDQYVFSNFIFMHIYMECAQ